MYKKKRVNTIRHCFSGLIVFFFFFSQVFVPAFSLRQTQQQQRVSGDQH